MHDANDRSPASLAAVTGHVSCLLEGPMSLHLEKIEARFHPPHAPAGTFVVVAHLTWENKEGPRYPRIEPAETLDMQGSPAALFSTLRHLVRLAGHGSSARLVALSNRFWSFAPLPAPLPTRVDP